MANESVQKAAKCIIGKDYPVAMIDHSQSIRVNRERMRIVFQQLSKYRPRKFGFSLTKLTSKPDVPSNATFFPITAANMRGQGESTLNFMLAKAQSSTQGDQHNSSPSPNTILRNVHNSGNYICSQRMNPSPVIKYHEHSSAQSNNPINYNDHGEIPYQESQKTSESRMDTSQGNVDYRNGR